MTATASKNFKVELTLYGVAEIVKWCITRNEGRIPGVDTAGFKAMQAALKEKPASGDYFTFDQFWRQTREFEFTKAEVEVIDRCLYDIPNFDAKQNPQIRYKFWPAQSE